MPLAHVSRSNYGAQGLPSPNYARPLPNEHGRRKHEHCIREYSRGTCALLFLGWRLPYTDAHHLSFQCSLARHLVAIVVILHVVIINVE
jgi:hypothetical protein